GDAPPASRGPRARLSLPPTPSWIALDACAVAPGVPTSRSRSARREAMRDPERHDGRRRRRTRRRAAACAALVACALAGGASLARAQAPPGDAAHGQERPAEEREDAPASSPARAAVPALPPPSSV